MARTWFIVLGVCLVLLLQVGDGFAKAKGDWIAWLRGIAVLTDTGGTTDALGGDARTSDDFIPELDFSYFFTDNIAAELILGTSKHNVEVKRSTSGDLDLGTVRTLPVSYTHLTLPTKA